MFLELPINSLRWTLSQRAVWPPVKKENKPALLELWEDRYYYFVLKFERGVLSAQDKSGTLATIQVDVESTLEYLEDKDGKKRQKYNISFKDTDDTIKHPIILHNSPSGGLERILWGLIETAYREKEKIVPLVFKDNESIVSFILSICQTAAKGSIIRND